MLLGTGLLCLGLASVIPQKGIDLGIGVIRFPDIASLFEPPPPPAHIDVEAYLARLDSIQSIQQEELNTLTMSRVVRKEGITSIQFREQDSSPFFPFFEELERAREEGKRVHILHYGDSQIEMDRMTGYLRQEWQKRFGGNGPGLLPPVPLAPPSHVTLKQSGNWKRFTAYGYDNGKVEHGRYGILASMGRFAPPSGPDAKLPTDTLEAWIEISGSKMAKSEARTYTGCTVYFGYQNKPVELSILANDSLVSSTIHVPSTHILRESVRLGRTPDKLKLVFRGTDSPDVQAILLDHGPGVYVDNIALRGSNGNIFKRIAPVDMRYVMDDLDVGMIILQFGGNSVPYVTSEKQATEYASFFASQIRYLRKLAPDAAFLVIGPSDMSTTIDGVYQSWPGLELIRDAMKNAAFKENCGFWDMYEVMGGANSMISWVENDPPYAGPDYTHFTPLGARKIAEFLYKSLMKEYDSWQTGKTRSPESS